MRRFLCSKQALFNLLQDLTQIYYYFYYFKQKLGQFYL